MGTIELFPALSPERQQNYRDDYTGDKKGDCDSSDVKHMELLLPHAGLIQQKEKRHPSLSLP
jgi:hypothetical protein